MKKLVVIMLLFLVAGGCTGQKKENEKAQQQLVSLDSLHKPKVDVKVNKKYDDKGNLIHFDSTYSYFYSSPEFNKLDSINSDSFFRSFKLPLLNQYDYLMDKNNGSIFSNDSLFKYDLYNDDYLGKHFYLNIPKFEELHMKKINK